jgi:hypothetical protein
MKARFRCDNCGRQVPLKHDTCPHCGKRFTAVLCPVCQFEGDASLFRGGCPSCGYQGARTGGPPAVEARPKKTAKPPLPGWFYFWSSVALLVVLALFVFVLLRPQ